MFHYSVQGVLSVEYNMCDFYGLVVLMYKA